jgi:6-phosphogluconolactonase (cycloisomerase 2 family)
MRYRWILLVALLAGCGGGGGGNEGAVSTVARFAFVANLGTTDGVHGTLSAFTVNATSGLLRHNGYVVTTSGAGLTSVAVDPSNRFVYTTNAAGVWGYAINATTGALTSLSNSAFTDGGGNPVAIAIDPLGRFAFVANGGLGVSAYTVNATTGVLTPVATPVAAGGVPNSIAVDPSGRFVYVASQGSNGVSQFSINATTGALTALAPSLVATAVAPLGIGIDPSGRNLYVVGAGATSNVLGFTIGANGTLTPFVSGPVAAGTDPRAITFDAAGHFAYVANQTSNNVTVFQVTNGVLSAPVSAATQGSQTWTAALEPSGHFAYAVNQGSGDVTLFSVNAANGSLSPQGSVAARFSPGSIAFTRSTSAVTYTPRFAYTGNLGSNDVSAFRIDAGSGALTLVTNPPIASGGVKPFPVAADPTGRFLFVGHEGTSNVQAFSINAASGALTALGAAVATGGANADGLTVDPSGRFAYAGNVDSANTGVLANQTITPISINTGTGALTAGTPVQSGGSQPFSPVVDPSGRFLYTADLASSNVSAFLINPSTGGLTAVSLQPFAAATSLSPFALVVSPSGRFVYVANFTDTSFAGTGNISVFKINLGSGALSEISGSPYPVGSVPRSIAIHPTGRFVYVGNEGDSTVTAYQADPSTGALTLVTGTPGSPFPVGGALRPIAVDPSGRFLYAGRTGAAGVSAFAIDSTTGALGTVIGGAPVATGNGTTTGVSPFTITTTGTIQ